MGVGDLVDLPADPLPDHRIGMTQTGHGRSPRSVEVSLSGFVDEIHPVTGNGDWIAMAEITMEHLAHGKPPGMPLVA